MIHKILAATAIAVMATTTLGAADYCFPSPNPPGGKSPSEVKQYVSFIWDDNAYSGLAGTSYEQESGGTAQVTASDEATWGMSWAVRKLAGNRKNPDNSAVTMSFNVTAGQMVPAQYDAAINNYKGYKGKRYKTESWETGLLGDFAVIWGREQPKSPAASWDQNKPHLDGAINKTYKEAKDAGHEIGNHTIDHMETNSPLPKEFWPNSGEGFDTDPNEGENPDKPSWETFGWLKDAGYSLSQKGWSDAITLAEEVMDEHLDISVSNKNLFSFRAPRLEVSAGLYFALSEKGYVYDCGITEGYEENRDGTNFLWPYTMDNGSPSTWQQKDWGERVTLDSLPAGLWEFPITVMIVPTEIRADVYPMAQKIYEADGNVLEGTWESWDGKIAGFDFNQFIMWGMTGDQVLKTLKHTLDLRITGNKAPLHVGCHTDYFTPIYDNATLKNDPAYKLALPQNRYTDRIATFEKFADYALEQGAYLVSGIEVINAMKAMMADVEVGTEYDALSKMEWEFQGDAVESTTDTEKISGAIDATINLKKEEVPKLPNGEYDWDHGKYPSASYYAPVEKGSLKGLDHISFTYKANQTLKLVVYVDGDQPWEVLLNNVGPETESGNIPLTAFGYDQYVEFEEGQSAQESIDTEKIIGFGIAPKIVGDKDEAAHIKISSFKTYGAEVGSTPITKSNTVKEQMGITSITNNNLSLTVPTNGLYTVKVIAANGRILRSFSNQTMTQGSNTLGLNQLSSGVYIIQVKGVDNKLNMTESTIIL